MRSIILYISFVCSVDNHGKDPEEHIRGDVVTESRGPCEHPRRHAALNRLTNTAGNAHAILPSKFHEMFDLRGRAHSKAVWKKYAILIPAVQERLRFLYTSKYAQWQRNDREIPLVR